MNISCKYAKVVHCKECDAAFYLKCKKFKKAHLAFLCKEILPFKFKNVTCKPSVSVYWSKDQNAMKSVALKIAARLGSKIVKLSFNQVLGLCLSNEDIDGRIFYIECPTKLFGDLDKISSVIRSFVDKQTLKGSYICIYTSQVSLFNFSEYAL